MLGSFCGIPHILLFCILAAVILVPMELGVILSASKRENGVYSLKSAFAGQEKLPLWEILIFVFVLLAYSKYLAVKFYAPIYLFMQQRLFCGTLTDERKQAFRGNAYEHIHSFFKKSRACNIANVLVVGANQGIGYYLAERLLQLGNTVTVLDIQIHGIEILKEKYQKALLPIIADARILSGIENGVLQAVPNFGDIDIAIQNACLCTFESERDTVKYIKM